MESSQTHLRLGVIRPSRRYRIISRYLRLPLRNTTRTGGGHLLPVLLLPIPTILLLWNIRPLLDSQMANLSMERRMGLPWKILAVPRRILQHHPRTTCERRDHQRTIRTADARPPTAQLRPIIIRWAHLFSSLNNWPFPKPVLAFSSNRNSSGERSHAYSRDQVYGKRSEPSLLGRQSLHCLVQMWGVPATSPSATGPMQRSDSTPDLRT